MTVDLCQNRDTVFHKLAGQLVFLDVALLMLEHDQHDRKVLNQMLRSVQTIRSTSQRSNYPELEQFALDLEDLLTQVRDGLTTISTSLIHLLRRCVDALESGVESLRLGLPLPSTFDDVRFNLLDMLARSAATIMSFAL